MIDAIFLASEAIIFLSAALILIRAVKGPSIFDRISAIDTIGLAVVGYLLLQTSAHDSWLYIDAAVVLAHFAFIGPVFLGYFLGEGELDDE